MIIMLSSETKRLLTVTQQGAPFHQKKRKEKKKGRSWNGKLIQIFSPSTDFQFVSHNLIPFHRWVGACTENNENGAHPYLVCKSSDSLLAVSKMWYFTEKPT